MKIAGSTIAICAEGGGMGPMIARYLVRAGATVVLIEEGMSHVDEHIQTQDCKFYQLLFDAQQPQNSHRIFEQIDELVGPVDIFIHYWPVAVRVRGLADDVMAQLSGTMAQMVSRLTWLGQEAAKQMQSGREGVILYMMAPEQRGTACLESARVIIDGFMQTWAKELSPYNIRVGGVVPICMRQVTTDSYRPICLQELVRSAEYIIENDYFSGRLLETEMSLVF